MQSFLQTFHSYEVQNGTPFNMLNVLQDRFERTWSLMDQWDVPILSKATQERHYNQRIKPLWY